MAERIHTSKVLNNSYFSGNNVDTDFSSSSPMTVSPVVADQYDFALTEDPVLLQERKDTAEKLYEIFINSPFAEKYKAKNGIIMKIPKENIPEVFEYTRKELAKVKTLTAMEVVIAINEFYDFNYDHVYKKVLTPQMKQEILEDYYNNMGMKNRMDEGASERLF